MIDKRVSSDDVMLLAQHLELPIFLCELQGAMLYCNDCAENWIKTKKENLPVPVETAFGLSASGAADFRAKLLHPSGKWEEFVYVLSAVDQPVRIRHRSIKLASGDDGIMFFLRPAQKLEKSYEEALSGSPIFFFEALPTGRLTYGQHQMAAVLNRHAAPSEHESLLDRIAPSDRDRFEKRWQSVLQGRPERGTEVNLVDDQGAMHPFWISLLPVNDLHNDAVAVMGIAGNLAEQKGLAYALEAAEERFNVLFQESSDPIMILSMQGEIMTVNPAFENASGLSSSTLFSNEKSWSDFVVAEDLSRLLESVHSCATNTGEEVIEFRMKTPDGNVWFEQTHSILHDEHGNPRGIMAVARDITLHKQRELRWREAAEVMQKRHQRSQDLITRLTHFFEKINELPASIDQFLSGVCDLLFDMYRPLMVQITTFEDEKVATRSSVELPDNIFECHQQPHLCPTCLEVVGKGAPFYCNELITTLPYKEDKTVKRLQLQTYLGAPLRDSSGRIRGTLSLIDTRMRDFDHLDIELWAVAGLQIGARLRSEEHKEMEQELEEHLRQSQKMEAVGMLAGGIAHDFNNVLSGILGFSSFLLAKVDEGTDTHRYLKLIEQSAIQAADLTRHLLSFTRKSPMAKETFNVNDTIREVVGIVSHSIAKSMQIDTELQHDLPDILGDRGQLNQVFMNLCINAAEAIGEGEGAISITTECRPLTPRESKVLVDTSAEEYVCVHIKDNGPGMEKDIMEHIFEPFFTTKSTSGGSGLGLSIVYNIISSHQGDISVESVLDEGTTFHIYLPAWRGEAVQKKNKAADNVHGVETVLVIDDEAVVREMVAEILKANGYTPILASSGREGLKLVTQSKEGEIDMILLDMLMPDMDGEATFAAIQSVRPEIPVTITTGFAKEDSCAKLIAAGARGVIRKPYKSQEFLQKLRQAVSGTLAE